LLAPNIKLNFFRARLSLLYGRIRINTAFDLRYALLMTKDHLYDLNRTTYHNRGNGNKPNTKTHNRLHHRCSYKAEFGGADRDRTGGLLVANQALSQLSYSPTDFGGPG
jgi:hypothetical protein